MTLAARIAIDGTAGSGKSTLGQALAERLKYLYFDTGVLYRALTWLALERGVSPTDAEALARLARDTRIDVLKPTVDDGRLCTVVVGEVDVSWAIREPRVDANVSAVSAHPLVRQALLAAQREVAARGRVVMVGRDVGTVVVPEAELKIFLRASLPVRARRRRAELMARGHDVSDEAVQAELRSRDEIDSNRATAPLAVAPDAVVIDSGEMSVHEEVDLVERLAWQVDCHD